MCKLCNENIRCCKKEGTRLKIFYSHPIYGLSEKEVMLLRQKTLKKLRKRCGSDIEVIDNYHHKDTPANAGRLWHLGTSVRQMEEADAICFDSR